MAFEKVEVNGIEKTFYIDDETGARKEVKLARFDLVPPSAELALAEHYGKGAIKYGERNMEQGYPYSHSYAALRRHINAWYSGEDFDSENGSSHLIAVAWHAFTLFELMRTHPEKDDRPKIEDNES